jgi:ECF transporter S component (folate family)
MPKVKRIVLSGLFLATAIIFEQLLGITITPTLRLSLSFIPYVLIGWLLGPVWGAVIGVTADILGMLLFPTGDFFIGYTFNELLTTLIYGFFLFGRPLNKKLYIRLAVSLALVRLIVVLGLNTLWLSIQVGKAFMLLLPTRIVVIVLFPIEFAAMFLLMRFMEKPVARYLESMRPDSGEDDIDDEVNEDSKDTAAPHT